MATPAVLRLENLTRRYGTRTAMDGVSLTIPLGQMVGIIGRSGAGKSTLLLMATVALIDFASARIRRRLIG